jgi:hypothetical protein
MSLFFLKPQDGVNEHVDQEDFSEESGLYSVCTDVEERLHDFSNDNA